VVCLCLLFPLTINIKAQVFTPSNVALSTRETLKEYDAGLFALVEETMAYKGKVDWRYRK